MCTNVDEEVPDFVNDIGAYWWFDHSLTNYARATGLIGKIDHPLKKAECWKVRLLDATNYDYLVINHGKILAEGKTPEELGIKIDLLKGEFVETMIKE